MPQARKDYKSLLVTKPIQPELTEIKIAPVDSLLAELQGVKQEMNGSCKAKCDCPPCTEGNCNSCTVDRTYYDFGNPVEFYKIRQTYRGW
jgi:hypothetical protein